MKLSKLIKAQDVELEKKIAEALPSPPRPVSPPPQSRLPKSPAGSDIQNELKKLIEKKEEELKLQAEQSRKELEERLLDREATFQKERREFLTQIEALQRINEQIREDLARDREAELKRQHEGEQDLKLKFDKEWGHAEERIKMLEQEMMKRQLALAKKENEFEAEIKKRIESAAAEQEKKYRDEIEKRDRLIKDFQNQASSQTRADAGARAPALDKFAEPVQPVPKETPPVKEVPVPPVSMTLSGKISIPSKVIELTSDPEVARKLRKLYEDLVLAITRIFDAVGKKATPDLSPLDPFLTAIVDYSLFTEPELTSLALEPYPDPVYFSHHAVNCAILAIVLGLDYKLSKEQSKDLAMAALLHDTGLVSIQENLDYPKQISAETQAQVLKHPERGAEILDGLCNDEVLTAIRQHHEIDTGKGYPKGLAAAEIHSYAKIIQCVDSFEAMIHIRPYRKKPLEVSVAVKEMIEKGRGVYDREALKSLISRIGLYAVNTLVELSNKRIARVMKQNRLSPMSPTVRLEFDEFGNKIKDLHLVDLAQNQLVHIIGPVGTVSSIQKEKMDQEKKLKTKKTLPLQEFIPFAFIVLVLALLLFVVFKI